MFQNYRSAIGQRPRTDGRVSGGQDVDFKPNVDELKFKMNHRQEDFIPIDVPSRYVSVEVPQRYYSDTEARDYYPDDEPLPKRDYERRIMYRDQPRRQQAPGIGQTYNQPAPDNELPPMGGIEYNCGSIDYNHGFRGNNWEPTQDRPIRRPMVHPFATNRIDEENEQYDEPESESIERIVNSQRDFHPEMSHPFAPPRRQLYGGTQPLGTRSKRWYGDPPPRVPRNYPTIDRYKTPKFNNVLRMVRPLVELSNFDPMFDEKLRFSFNLTKFEKRFHYKVMLRVCYIAMTAQYSQVNKVPFRDTCNMLVNNMPVMRPQSGAEPVDISQSCKVGQNHFVIVRGHNRQKYLPVWFTIQLVSMRSYDDEDMDVEDCEVLETENGKKTDNEKKLERLMHLVTQSKASTSSVHPFASTSSESEEIRKKRIRQEVMAEINGRMRQKCKELSNNGVIDLDADILVDSEFKMDLDFGETTIDDNDGDDDGIEIVDEVKNVLTEKQTMMNVKKVIANKFPSFKELELVFKELHDIIPAQILEFKVNESHTLPIMLDEDVSYIMKRSEANIGIIMRLCRVNESGDQIDQLPANFLITIDNKIVMPDDVLVDLKKYFRFKQPFNIEMKQNLINQRVGVKVSLVRYLDSGDIINLMNKKPETYVLGEASRVKSINQRLRSLALDEITLPLICKTTNAKIKVPFIGKNCKHLHCFEGMQFVENSGKALPWKCGHCGEIIDYDDLRIDGYLQEILSEVYSIYPDCEDIEVKIGGIWKPTISC